MASLINSKGWKIYLALILLSALFTFADKVFFFTDSFYYNSLAGQYELYRIREALELLRKWEWVIYAVIPFTILTRVFYTSAFLYIGVFFTQLKISFAKLFKITLLADFVYILAAAARLIVFLFFRDISGIEDVAVKPFSVLDLLDNQAIDPLFIAPLRLLNIFELLYFLVLAMLLIPVLHEFNPGEKLSYAKSLSLVAASYGSGLLLWTVFVMFFTLTST